MKFKVGDVLYFNNTNSNSPQNRGPCIVVAITKDSYYKYTVDVINGQGGWKAMEEELRPLTKLDKALS